MNHPRHLLLLVPLALLGAALLVRSRLPRPQTENDKWLWGQGESVTCLNIELAHPQSPTAQRLHITIPHQQWLQIETRRGIRALFRTLEQTGPFKPTAPRVMTRVALVKIIVTQNRLSEDLLLTQGPEGYALCRPDYGALAPVKPHSALRFLAELRRDVAKAQRKAGGYEMFREHAAVRFRFVRS